MFHKFNFDASACRRNGGIISSEHLGIDLYFLAFSKNPKKAGGFWYQQTNATFKMLPTEFLLQPVLHICKEMIAFYQDEFEIHYP